MARGMPTFGPVLMIVFVLAFVAVLLVFANVIFAQNEATVNTTAFDETEYENYNASTQMVQTGLGVFSITGYLLIGAIIMIAVYILGRAAR